jgi:hypothetical protein
LIFILRLLFNCRHIKFQALAETIADEATGRLLQESAEAHVARLETGMIYVLVFTDA